MELMRAKAGLTYSIVIASYNTLADLTLCIQSINRHTKDYEIIVVDNGSTDGSRGYLKDVIKRQKNIKIILNEKNRNFGPANNQGLAIAEGEYFILLNSDTVVTPGWAESMKHVVESKPNVAMVGPVTNSSNGRQCVGEQFKSEDAEIFACDWSNRHKGQYEEAGILYGWCMFVSRKFLQDEEYLFDEQFVNSYEDNDLCLRARLRGFRLYIDYSTFIYHRGQASFQREWNTEFYQKYLKNGRENQLRYFDKWKPKENQKLTAVYRIANCEQYLRESLDQTSKFADEIICLVARSSDSTEQIARSYPKVTLVEVWNEPEHPFNEQAERNWLLQAAIGRGADWIISIDGDEVYEDKLVENVRTYMEPSNPEVMGYWCNWRTIWDKEDGVEKYRYDGIFGGFQNYRFFKVIDGMQINPNRNIYNHHCGSAPFIPTENIAWLNVRVKHLGYDTPEQRKRKHEFYRKADPRPVTADVGNADYHHLIDKNVSLKTYRENNRLTVMTVCHNEADNIYRMLENLSQVADEYVIVDTGSTDGTLDEIEHFRKLYKKPVKVVTKIFDSMKAGRLYNYSEAKNYAKSLCTTEWILNMDCDELFDSREVCSLFAMIDEDVDAILFKVINYLSPPTSSNPLDNDWCPSETIRLYRNIPELYYTGLVHESLEDAMMARTRRGHRRALVSPIPIHHRGYLKSKDKVREKGDRYHEINTEQFKISGDEDPRPLFNMSSHYLNDDMDQEALECLGKALQLRPDFWRARLKLAYYWLNAGKMSLKDAIKHTDPLYMTQELSQLAEFLDKYNFVAKKTG